MREIGLPTPVLYAAFTCVAELSRQPSTMTTLVWTEFTIYYSTGNERAFFAWFESIPGVLKVEGRGRELHIQLHSKRLSATALRELLALYVRYAGS